MSQSKAKRASYREAVAWIALNDEAGSDMEDIEYLLTVALVADLFGKDTATVARAVVAYRKRVR